jgi:hypothetical protein
MYEIKEYNENLDLTYFYNKCKEKGFINNSSKSKLIKNLKKEKEFKLWILYYNNKPVGSTAFHSFDDVMGENSYRICVRSCVLSDELNIKNIRSIRGGINKHQYVSSQFFIPLCIEWTPKDSKLYITTSNKDEASMRLVHNLFFPELSKIGIVKKIKNIFYGGVEQTVWQLIPEVFLESLNKCLRWDYKYIK